MRTARLLTTATSMAGLAVFAAGCGHGRVLPASEARVVPGAPAAAVVEQDGVRMAANGDDWYGQPLDLAEHVTPLKVRIVNHSGKPVLILYDRFTLGGSGGHVYRPLPTVPIDGSRNASAFLPVFASENFFVGPRLHEVYPSLATWPSPLPRDDKLYQRQLRRWQADLPTREMQRMALPEGVLGDGGQISGFLYFENAADREKRFVFTADLQDGQDGAPVTSIEIPFRVE